MAEVGTHIIVVGAGIGGLTAALSLSRAGFRVTVLERTHELLEVGAGIQLSPNASRILIDLDLGSRLRSIATCPDAIRIYSTRSGGEVTSLPLGAEFAARYGAPYMVVHRADLQAALFAAASGIESIDIRLGVEIKTISDTGRSIELETFSGSRFSADALIGADGVRSAIRTDVLGRAPARYSGRIAFRATIPIEIVPDDARYVTCVWMAPNAHLVHYPISGGNQLNLVVVIESTQNCGGIAGTISGSELEQHLKFDSPPSWPAAVRRLLRAPASWTSWTLAAVDPHFNWSRGRITLLGDAAHAMLPFAAQGGAMAIEDAAVLAAALVAERDIVPALKDYEVARKRRVSAVANIAAKNGRIYHLAGMAGFARDAALRALPARTTLSRNDWIYSWRVN